MSEPSNSNKNDLQTQNLLSSPNASQTSRPIIPVTIIPKIDVKPNLIPVKSPKPETSVSRPYRLVPVQSCKDRKTVNFSVLGPIAITLEEDSINNNLGCSVLDLIMPAPSQIGELVFRNFYTAWITVLVYFEKGTPIQFTNKCAYKPCNKVIGPLPGGAKPSSSTANGNEYTLSMTVSNSDMTNICEWIVAVPRHVLMPNPNYEAGSQEFISILASESFVVLENVKALRLVLHQPSPIWQTFYVEELNIYSDVVCNTVLQPSDIHFQVNQNPLLALLRCQTMGIISRKCKNKANAPSNMEIPVYEFFNLSLDSHF